MSFWARIVRPVSLELGKASRLALAPDNIIKGAILDVFVVASLEAYLQGLGVLFHLFVLPSIMILVMFRLMAEYLFSYLMLGWHSECES